MSLEEIIKEVEQANSELKVLVNHYEHKDQVVADYDFGGMFCTQCEVAI